MRHRHRNCTENMSEERLAKKREGDRADTFSEERGERRSESQQCRRADEKEECHTELAAINVHER